jgi:hypothetical protein
LLSLIQETLAADQRAAKARKSFRIALAASLAVHALAIFLPLLLSQPPGGKQSSPYRVHAPLQATIAKRSQAPSQAQIAAVPTPATKPLPAQQSRKQRHDSIITSKKGNWSVPNQAQSTPEKLSGRELARRALAMARSGMAGAEDEGGTDAYSTQQDGQGKDIEPLSLEYYFDSFVKKLNQSSRFVARQPPSHGQRAAEVEIIINRDGSLREYRVKQAADRQIEVDYIRAVAERAAPFAAFPKDIASKTDKLSLTICIQPPGDPGGGFGFSRTSGKNC